LKSRKRPAGIDPATFMRRHWQRRPLLVRGAFADFRDPLSPREVLALAASRDAVSRLVRHRGSQWRVEQGPIPISRFKQLPRRDWTVLVQDANHFSSHANRLLESFDFIPHARVDDVMVSYAVPGGGVGPHVDSYDVFLLQGRGRRRWQISRQEDHAFIPGLELRILQRFEADEEWVLGPGDMLYLPPGVAHNGIAESECLTWSIGFRAPADREIVAGFLGFLDEKLEPVGRYGDPGVAATRHAGEVPPAMLAHIGRALGSSVRWTRHDVRDFAGRYLSEPKQNAFFTPPSRPLLRAAFERRAAAAGLVLDSRSRLLFSGTMFYMNGEAGPLPARSGAQARALADGRKLEAPVRAPRAFWDTAHAWYLQGFVHVGEKS
jgi:50S ribosomal protein L16 3-hydroxylase